MQTVKGFGNKVAEYHGVLWLTDQGYLHSGFYYEITWFHLGFDTTDIIFRLRDRFGKWITIRVSQLKCSQEHASNCLAVLPCRQRTADA